MRFRSIKVGVCLLLAVVVAAPVAVFGAPPQKGGSEKQWTIQIFWAADNSLEFTTEFCMQLWEKALTSNKDVNIIVFVDILSADGAWVYEIAGGTRKVVQTWPEMN